VGAGVGIVCPGEDEGLRWIALMRRVLFDIVKRGSVRTKSCPLGRLLEARERRSGWTMKQVVFLAACLFGGIGSESDQAT
jgi:hypothetical protein